MLYEMVHKGCIKNSQIWVEPPEKLLNFLKSNVNESSSNVPKSIRNLLRNDRKKEDRAEPSLSAKSEEETSLLLNESEANAAEDNETNLLIGVEDIRWINQNLILKTDGVYLHELLQGCRIVLPKNESIVRSPVLDQRCQEYKNLFKNREYEQKTTNVDLSRDTRIEESSNQDKELSRDIFVVVHFVLSVLTGFAFGYFGIGVLVGDLSTAVRLFIGIGFAILVAVAELYFICNRPFNLSVNNNNKYKYHLLDNKAS